MRSGLSGLCLLIIVLLCGCTGVPGTTPAPSPTSSEPLTATASHPLDTAETPTQTQVATPTPAALQLPIGDEPGYLQLHPTDPLSPSIAFSPGGDVLATGYYTQEFVILWDMTTGEQIRTLMPPEVRSPAGTVEPQNRAGAADSIAFSPDGSLIAVAYSHLKRVLVWNLSTGELERSLEVTDYGLRQVKFSPDGKLLAGGVPRIQNNLGVVYLWDTETWTTRHILYDAAPPFAFSRDGSMLATVSGLSAITGIHPGSVDFWDTSSGLKINRFQLDGHVVGMDFDSEQSLLAVTLLETGPVAVTQLVDSDSGKALGVLDAASANGEPIKGVGDEAVISPDGSWLAVRYQPNTIILWSIPKAEQVRVFEGPADGLIFPTFSPDGKMLAASALDRIVFWNMPSD